MVIQDFFNSPEELDSFLAETRKYKKDFRMVVKGDGLYMFYNGVLKGHKTPVLSTPTSVSVQTVEKKSRKRH